MTKQQIEQLSDALTKAIEDGFKSGFKEKYKQDFYTRAFNPDGSAMKMPGKNATKEEWDKFLAAVSKEKRDEHEAQIIDKIERLRESNIANSALVREEIKRAEEDLERSQNGGVSKNDVKKYRAAKIGAVTESITKILESAVDIYVAFQEKNIAITRANLEYRSKIEQLSLERDSKIISQGMKSITSGFSKNAFEMAYDATSNAYDLAQTNIRASQEIKIAGKTFSKDIASAKADFAGSMLGASTAGLAAAGALIGTAIAPGIGTAIGAIIGTIGGFLTNAFKKLAGVDIKKMELAIKEAELVSNVMQQYVQKFSEYVKPWDELYKATTDFVLKLDDAGKRFGVTIGYTGDRFSNTLIDMAQVQVVGTTNLAEVFGKEVEQIPQYLDNFMTASMRNVMLSAEDLGNVMGTAKIFGISGGESSNIYGSMNIFNTSVSSAADSMGIMYHQLTKMGLSSKKFGKDLVQNLKLAEKYNFKGGVDNMMKLTKWAQQTRFNLSSAASFSDKLIDGSLSDVLEQSAKLQVLGGNAAIYSDPLGMLYDAGADVGDMAQRMHKMFGDISGTFNSETGETTFSWYENKMLTERAKALGMDPGEVKNMIRQNQKQGVIDKILGNNLSEEDRLAIGNRATYNKKSGNWEVVDIKGVKHDINEYINGNANIDELLPADTQESILEVAQKSLSYQENLENEVVAINTKLGGTKKKDIFETVDRERITQSNFYKNNFNEVLGGWDAAREHSEAMFNANIDLMKKTAGDLSLIKNIYQGFEKEFKSMIEDKTFEHMKEGAKNFADSASALQHWVEGMIKHKDKEISVWEEAFKQRQEAARKDLPKIEKELSEAYKNKEYGKAFVLENAKAGAMSTLSRTKMTVDGFGDGIGNMNGGYIVGASNVKSINDGIVKTSLRDQYVAAETGGPIDILFKQLLPGLQALLIMLKNNGNNTLSSAINVNFGGRIDLSQDGSTINLVELMQDNPAMAMKFVKLLERTFEANKNGKPIHNYMI